MKVFGEGEWPFPQRNERTHGKSKRRTWRKVHLSVDPETHEIVAEVLPDNSKDDASQVASMLEQIDQPVETFYGDGGYDKWKVYNLLETELLIIKKPDLEFDAKLSTNLPNSGYRSSSGVSQQGRIDLKLTHNKALLIELPFHFHHTVGLLTSSIQF